VKEIEAPLFPGYVFCRFDLRQRFKVLSIPVVASIVGAGKEAIPIEDAEIESIRILISSGLPALAWPFLKRGQNVLIHKGPLAGVEGTLIEVNQESKVVVSITLLQRSVAVRVERDWIEPVSALYRPSLESYPAGTAARL
jgi:transcription antitermination factor NusG